jgi:hypothetical protein
LIIEVVGVFCALPLQVYDAHAYLQSTMIVVLFPGNTYSCLPLSSKYSSIKTLHSSVFLVFIRAWTICVEDALEQLKERVLNQNACGK